MKKLLFVLFALMAATLVIGLTVAMTRSGEGEIEIETEAEAETDVDEAVEAATA